MPAGQEIANGTTIAGDESVESPFIAQYLLFVTSLRAAGLAVDTLIGAHNLGHLSLLHQCLEGGEISLPEVALGQVLHVELMAVPLGATMDGKVLGTGEQLAVLAHAEIFAVIAYTLQATHDGKAHLRREIGILAVGLLPAPPSGIAEDIDVGRPERKALVTLDVARTLGLLRFHTGLIADSRKDLMQQGIIPGGCHRHGDGENGGKTVTPYTVQGLAPPMETGDAQALDGRRGVHHQTDLLVERQA